MFTQIKQKEAYAAFPVLAAVSDDARDAGVAIACLAVILGHSDLTQQAQSHKFVLRRLARRVQRLCEEELGRKEVGAIYTARFCALQDLKSVADELKIQSKYKGEEIFSAAILAERYRLLIPGQKPK